MEGPSKKLRRYDAMVGGELEAALAEEELDMEEQMAAIGTLLVSSDDEDVIEVDDGERYYHDGDEDYDMEYYPGDYDEEWENNAGEPRTWEYREVMQREVMGGRRGDKWE